MKINAIVLAAGFGSRLSPLTFELPKPALPLAGVPMLVRILQKLKDAGIDSIAVNTHHLKEKIEECVAISGCENSVRLFYETEILGTAGPLVNAKELLSDCDYFLLHNSDVVCNFDLKAMLRQHAESGATVTMAAIDGPENRLHVTPDGSVIDILDQLKRPYAENDVKRTYACIAIYSRDFFDFLPEKPCNSSLLDAWLSAIRAGKRIKIYSPPEPYSWNDIGSFEQYFEANRCMMTEQPFQAGKDCRIAADAVFSGFVSLGDRVVIPEGTTLLNCIVLPGTKVPAGFHAWEVISPRGTIHRDQKNIASLHIMQDQPEDWHARSLPEQGSDRKFIRLHYPDRSTKVLMISSDRDKDFDRFTTLGKCFHANHLFTPEIYSVCREEYTVLMEDLGNDTIYRLAVGKETENIPLYKQVIHTLAEFQVRGTQALDADNQEIRVFSHRYLRWETDYFKENFLGRLCGFVPDPATDRALMEEFEELASCVEKMPYLLIHRDFQSQNILLHHGKIRFVDYQGARLAPYTYDISSLLKDPYVVIPKAMRDELFQEYHMALAEQGYRIPMEQFQVHTNLTSLQRNMQALGAYGFLALAKKKISYLRYVSPCLELLLDSLDAQGTPSVFPVLKRLCVQAKNVLDERDNKTGGES